MAKFRRLHVPTTSNTIQLLLLSLVAAEFALGAVKLEEKDNNVIIDNGLFQMTLLKPDGKISGIKYKGIDNILDTTQPANRRGYWDISMGQNKGPQKIEQPKEFKIIVQNEKQVEVSFKRIWNPSLQGVYVPINIDVRFIVLDGSSGFYTYSINEHLNGWPDFGIGVNRIAFKLAQQLFRDMAVDDKRQRRMPLPEDRAPPRGQPLAYGEAVHLINPTDKEMAGQVDDKYMYSSTNENIKVHGFASIDSKRGPSVGFWHITPSFEYRSCGPFKQELTSHVGPTVLSNFVTAHYTGQKLSPKFKNGEPWKKVYGPVFVYLNSGPPGTDLATLWKDASNQLKTETQMWPYDFPASDDFPKAAQRGSVHGRLLVRDRFINKNDIPAANAYVGLAIPGLPGSWQTDFRGYQFWVRAGPDGSFVIKNVRAGVYNLYATVPGFIGDYKSDIQVTIKPGSNIDLGDSVFIPPRTGPTLWEIGIPDRSAGEFFVPNPPPNLINPLFNTFDRFRQYGIWEQYSILYPKEDLVYTINASDYHKDWFYAQVPRRVSPKTYQSPTWQIRFKLDNVVPNGIYALRVALASASYAKLEIRFNNPNVVQPHFTTGPIGGDNAVARHGTHGVYWLFNVDVKSQWLVQGDNTIFLRQIKCSGSFEEVMYDYIRFEGPSAAH